MSNLHGLARQQFVDAARSLFKRLAHTPARGPAYHVVAIKRGARRNSRMEIGVEFRPELAQLINTQIAKLNALFERITHSVTNLLVSLSERHSLVDKIGCRCHCIQIARLSGRLHSLVPEAQRPRKL